MKNITVLLCLALNLSFGQDLYKSSDYNFQIEFPDIFEENIEDRNEMHVISLSSSVGGMILLTSMFDYDIDIPSDEHNLKEVEALVVTADAFSSKFSIKKIQSWRVGKYEGYRNPIKGKVKTPSGKKINFYGCMYVLMIKDGLEFRITILSQSKKDYDAQVEAEFVGSFKVD
jgi:hypothetical protein